MTTYDIMIDIDDVLFPWADEIHARSRLAGLHELESYTSWQMWEDYGVPKEAWLDVVVQAAEDGMYVDVEPIPGSISPLRRLSWAGHRIHLVTARGFPMTDARIDHSEIIKKWTDHWVIEHAVPHDSLTFAKDKVAVQETLGVDFDYALDDGFHNYEELYIHGVKVYLLDRPHNRSIDVDYRVDSVEEFAQIVEAAA